MAGTADITSLDALEVAEETLRPEPWATDTILTCVHRLLAVPRRKEIRILRDTIVIKYARPMGEPFRLEEPTLEGMLGEISVDEYTGSTTSVGEALLEMSLRLSVDGLVPSRIVLGSVRTLRRVMHLHEAVPLRRLLGIPVVEGGLPADCLLLLGSPTRVGTYRDVTAAIKWTLPLPREKKE